MLLPESVEGLKKAYHSGLWTVPMSGAILVAIAATIIFGPLQTMLAGFLLGIATYWFLLECMTLVHVVARLRGADGDISLARAVHVCLRKHR